jgi:predicted DNA-binding WGR domain protein
MMTGPVDSVYLERIDLAVNARRFYYAYVGPTICGPFCVVRAQGAPDGRLGVWQRTLPPLVFADEAAAVRWLARLRARKLRRGYGEGGTAVDN